MKRRLLAVWMVLALLFLLLAGCSAPASGDSYNGGAPDEKGEGITGSNGGNLSDSDVLADRKLIRKVNLVAETENMDDLLNQVSLRIGELEGYVEAREIYNGSGNRSATLTIRIPADKLDAFVNQISGISNIISNKEESEDVTLQYTATESRLKVLKTEEERLLAFMAEAQSVSEMLEIEKRLTEVQAQLESITSQLRLYDNLVDYGTIHLRVEEVKQYTEQPEDNPTLWQQIATGFVQGLKNTGTILRVLLVVVISAIPYLLIPAAVFGIVLLIIKLRKRKK